MTSTKAGYGSRNAKSTPSVIAEVYDVAPIAVDESEGSNLDAGADVDEHAPEPEPESAVEEGDHAAVRPEQSTMTSLVEVPKFEDAVDGMHFCNQELAERLLQLTKSNRPKLDRSIRSLLGDERGNQWLAQVNGLLEHRDALSKEIVQQIMRGSMGIR